MYIWFVLTNNYQKFVNVTFKRRNITQNCENCIEIILYINSFISMDKLVCLLIMVKIRKKFLWIRWREYYSGQWPLKQIYSKEKLCKSSAWVLTQFSMVDHPFV